MSKRIIVVTADYDALTTEEELEEVAGRLVDLLPDDVVVTVAPGIRIYSVDPRGDEDVAVVLASPGLLEDGSKVEQKIRELFPGREVRVGELLP